jgi:hypothetical protein
VIIWTQINNPRGAAFRRIRLSANKKYFACAGTFRRAAASSLGGCAMMRAASAAL